MEGKSSNLDRLENDAFFYDVRSHTGRTVFGNPFVAKYIFLNIKQSIDYYYYHYYYYYYDSSSSILDMNSVVSVSR